MSCLLMPCEIQNSLNSVEVNSHPLSDRRHKILVPFSASANALKRWNSLRASDFNFNIDTHISREKSSTIRRKYLLPPNVDGVIGPHISM